MDLHLAHPEPLHKGTTVPKAPITVCILAPPRTFAGLKKNCSGSRKGVWYPRGRIRESGAGKRIRTGPVGSGNLSRSMCRCLQMICSVQMGLWILTKSNSSQIDIGIHTLHRKNKQCDSHFHRHFTHKRTPETPLGLGQRICYYFLPLKNGHVAW